MKLQEIKMSVLCVTYLSTPLKRLFFYIIFFKEEWVGVGEDITHWVLWKLSNISIAT